MFEAFFTTPLQMTTPLERTKWWVPSMSFQRGSTVFHSQQNEPDSHKVYFGGLQLSPISHPETFHEITFMKLERLKHKNIASLMLPHPPMCLN